MVSTFTSQQLQEEEWKKLSNVPSYPRLLAHAVNLGEPLQNLTEGPLV